MIKIGVVNGDVIEAGGVKNVTNNYYGKEVAQDNNKDLCIPGAFDTPKALELWEKAKVYGWVDENRKPKISHNKAAILASVIADILHLSPRWEAFETLWGISDLASKLSRSQNCKYYSDTLKMMEEALIIQG